MVAQTKEYENKKGKLKMKKSKKRFLCMALVVVLIMSLASTAFAYNYTENTVTGTFTDGSVTLKSYIRDNNTRCYYCPNATEYNTGYQSQAWRVSGSAYCFSSHAMSSGDPYKHIGYNGAQATGDLYFYNTDQPGQRIFLIGSMY